MVDTYTEYMLHCCRCAAVNVEPLTYKMWFELTNAVTRQL